MFSTIGNSGRQSVYIKSFKLSNEELEYMDKLKVALDDLRLELKADFHNNLEINKFNLHTELGRGIDNVMKIVEGSKHNEYDLKEEVTKLHFNQIILEEKIISAEDKIALVQKEIFELSIREPDIIEVAQPVTGFVTQKVFYVAIVAASILGILGIIF